MFHFFKKNYKLSIIVTILVIILLVLAILFYSFRNSIYKNSAYRLYLLEQGEASDEQIISFFHDTAMITEPNSLDINLLSNLLTELCNRGIKLEKKELLPLLAHPINIIRYQVILQLGAQIDSRNVAFLIKALDMPYEKKHHEIMLLLRVTTGEEIPDDPKAWKNWYKKLPDTSEFKQMQY